MAEFYIFLGPPGAGKGTQAAQIAEKCEIPHVSSGNIFRENLQNETELGKKAKEYMDAGELVPDDLTINMVIDRLSRSDCDEGAILDGFPRTPAQAVALSEYLTERNDEIACVPFINVPENELVERLSGRWVCRAEGHVYHMKYNPPRDDKICDIDRSELYQREDDKRETVVQRIQVYKEQTTPLINYYEEKGLLVNIDGDQSIENVTDQLLETVKC